MADALFTAAPIVSVVMPVYNSEAYLADSIGSILAQTFTDWELICIDDGSRDGSLEVLRRYERVDPRVHVFTRPNTGVTRARNDGIAVARGLYIAAMDWTTSLCRSDCAGRWITWKAIPSASAWGRL